MTLFGVHFEPSEPAKKGDFALFHPVTQGQNFDSDSQYPDYLLHCKTNFLLHPGLSFLQIQNKDNDNVTLLAPSRPWQRRKCFAAAALIDIALDGSRPVLNGARMGG